MRSLDRTLAGGGDDCGAGRERNRGRERRPTSFEPTVEEPPTEFKPTTGPRQASRSSSALASRSRSYVSKPSVKNITARGGRELPCTCLAAPPGGRGRIQRAASLFVVCRSATARALDGNFAPQRLGRLAHSSDRLESRCSSTSPHRPPSVVSMRLREPRRGNSAPPAEAPTLA